MFPIRDNIRSRHLPIITILLVVLNGICFWGELHLDETQIRELFDLYGIVPARFDGLRATDDGAYLSIFTSMFLHGSLLHIIANMWTLWIFADNVEDRMGIIRFTAFYFLCGAVAGCTHILSNPGVEMPAVGASGAIAGVLGAYFMLYPVSTIRTLVPIIIFPVFIDVPAFFFLGLWFLSQLAAGSMEIDGSAMQAIAWWAHIGGFLAGMLTHRLFLHPRR